MNIQSSVYPQWTCSNHNLVPTEKFKKIVQLRNFTKGKKIQSNTKDVLKVIPFFFFFILLSQQPFQSRTTL